MGGISKSERDVARIGLGAALVLLVIAIFTGAFWAAGAALLACVCLIYAQTPEDD